MEYARKNFWPCVTGSPWAWMCLAACTIAGAAGGVYFSWGHGRGGQALLTASYTAIGLVLAMLLIFAVLAISAPYREMQDNVDTLTRRIAHLESAPNPAAIQHVSAPKSDLELLGESARRNQKNVLRADLVLLKDELEANLGVLRAAIEISTFWEGPLKTSIWDAIKNKHISAAGFHRPRGSLTNAYNAIAEAERLRTTTDAPAMTPADRGAFSTLVPRMISGHAALTEYLDRLDGAAR